MTVELEGGACWARHEDGKQRLRAGEGNDGNDGKEIYCQDRRLQYSAQD